MASNLAWPASRAEPSPFAAISARKSANSLDTPDCSRSSARRWRLANTLTIASRALAMIWRSTSRTSASEDLSSVSETSFSNRSRSVSGKRWETPISNFPSRKRGLCSRPASNSGFARRPDWFMRPAASWMRRRAAARSGFWDRTRLPTLASVTTTVGSARSGVAWATRASSAVISGLDMVLRWKKFTRRECAEPGG